MLQFALGLSALPAQWNNVIEKLFLKNVTFSFRCCTASEPEHSHNNIVGYLLIPIVATTKTM